VEEKTFKESENQFSSLVYLNTVHLNTILLKRNHSWK